MIGFPFIFISSGHLRVGKDRSVGGLIIMVFFAIRYTGIMGKGIFLSIITQSALAQPPF